MFLYTNENYSHINNKIDIDENDALQEFKLFSNYIHAKDSKFLEKYRQEDKELIEDLKDVQKLKAIDIDFDSDSYLYCYDLFPNSEQMRREFNPPSEVELLDLEGIVYFLNANIYDEIYEIFLDNQKELSKKVIKKKQPSNKMDRLINFFNRKHNYCINMHRKQELPWLFERNSRKEIQKLVFIQTEEAQSPRLHNNINYQNEIMHQIERISY